MTEPYRASRDELEAIDEGQISPMIPETELPAHYRAHAAKLRREANTAPTIEMRLALLDAAERFDLMAEST